MYRAFNVKLDDSDLQNFATNYNYNDLSDESREKLKKLVNSSQKISADEIKNILLPQKHYDIFISHSHKDLNLAKRLADYLQNNCKVSCFIDSLYWGNIDGLQEELNKMHLREDASTGKKYFNHQSTMEVAKHANMILASALTMMIDSCECVFFLNTDNSVISGIEVINKNETYSPWIYHEVFTTSIIHRRKPGLDTQKAIHEHFQFRNDAINQLPQFIYNLDLTGMANLDDNDILDWASKVNSACMHPLDVLYNLKPERK